MENLNYYYEVVEKAIAKIGVDPKNARSKNAGKWTLTKGGHPIWIDVVFLQNQNRTYFRVVTPVMKTTDANRAEVSMELLGENKNLFGVYFGSNKEKVFIMTIREVEGLDMNEAYAMIMRGGNYGEHYSQLFAKKYGDTLERATAGVPGPNNA